MIPFLSNNSTGISILIYDINENPKIIRNILKDISNDYLLYTGYSLSEFNSLIPTTNSGVMICLNPLFNNTNYVKNQLENSRGLSIYHGKMLVYTICVNYIQNSMFNMLPSGPCRVSDNIWGLREDYLGLLKSRNMTQPSKIDISKYRLVETRKRKFKQINND